jgi:hypothetical protein
MPKGKKYGGRIKGTPNKFTATVKQVFAEAFGMMQGDPDVNLYEWGRQNPTDFYKLASKLIPIQAEVTGTDGDAIKVEHKPDYSKYLADPATLTALRTLADKSNESK